MVQRIAPSRGLASQAQKQGDLIMCDRCPIVASFDAAEKFIGEYAELHEDPEANLGIIALNRACTERVREVHPCPGPNLDRNGNIHCPLAMIISDAFTMSAYRPAIRPAIAIEKLADGEVDDSQSGQYL